MASQGADFPWNAQMSNDSGERLSFSKAGRGLPQDWAGSRETGFLSSLECQTKGQNLPSDIQAALLKAMGSAHRGQNAELYSTVVLNCPLPTP